MDIDLSTLSFENNKINISGEYQIPKEYYENTDIQQLKPVTVEGSILLDNDGEFHITCQIKGSMVLLDSISLEEVDYPFQIDYDDSIDENCKKYENMLDIFLFLWENIVLEVPLQFTKVEDLSKFHGDGWKLISEDEHRYQNNPFYDLLKDYDKE